MITIDNYFQKITDIDFSTLPEALRKGHEFILKGSTNGASWTFYSSSPTIKNTVDIYLNKLNEYVGKNAKAEDKETNTSQKQQSQTKRNRVSKLKSVKASKEVIETTMVERLPEELRFIKRYVNLNGKTKNKEEILRFINSLQKAIVEKRIRKTSPYADQVKYIQGKLIEVHNKMKTKIKLELQPETLESLTKLTSAEKVLVSIGFIKRYISMNGKPGMKEKAKQLLAQINRAIDKGRLADADPYIAEMHELKKNLKAFSTDKDIKY